MDEHVEQLLQDKRASIVDELADLAATPEEVGDISFGKRVGEGTSMAVQRLSEVRVHRRLQDTLAQVDRALVKTREGSYGVCDGCARAIPADRLEALPWAVRCMECAERSPS